MKSFDINIRGIRHHNVRAPTFFAACARIGVAIGEVTSVEHRELKPDAGDELVDKWAGIEGPWSGHETEGEDG